MQKEIWKDISGYEGLYQVNNLGQVKSLPRNTTKGKILTPRISAGYYSICLSKNGKVKQIKVHRLVANAFIPNPKKYRCIDHIDENRKNNNVSNLQWCTFKQNNEFRDLVYKKSLSRRGKSKKLILQIKDQKIISKYKTIHEAARGVNGMFQNIWKVLNGKRKNAYGFNWRYEK